MPLSLSKIEAEAPSLVSLAKKSRSALDATSLNGQTAKFALVLDYSGSMSAEYASGRIQAFAEQALAFGTQLDDDGAIDLFVFDSTAVYLGEVTINNFGDAIKKYTSRRRMGTTNYAAAFTAVAEHYKLDGPLKALSAPVAAAPTSGLRGFFKKATTATPVAAPVKGLTTPAGQPVLALFLTDGVPDSPADAVSVLTALSEVPIFWQFVSIGQRKIEFLQKLDDLTGRWIDNADYKHVTSVTKLTDDQLVHILLDEYPDWVAEEKNRNQIA